MNFYSKTCAAGISAVCLLGLVLVLLVPSLPILVPLLVILSVNLLLTLVVHIAVTPSTLGWFLMHAGVLVVSGGALYTQLSSVSGDVVLVADAEPVTTNEVVNLRVVRNPAQRTPLVGGAFVLLGFLLHAGVGRARS